MKIDLRLGDCIEVLKTIPDNSIDSIVTDPPYGISFLNKKWDYNIPKIDTWIECFRVLKPGHALLSFSSPRTYHRIASCIEDAGFDIKDQIMWITGSGFAKNKTQLKPSHEPIVFARKKGKVTKLNIDDSRIPYKSWEKINFDRPRLRKKNEDWIISAGFRYDKLDVKEYNILGRFPSNVIFENETDEVWSKYFFSPKANKEDRGEGNNHPTVKPTDLMRYLINLVTPKGGTTLDPFMGSGSTGKAAVQCGVNFIGIEKEEEYMKIAEARINHERNKTTQGNLF